MLEVANSVIAKLSKSEAKNYISQIIFDESRSNSSEVVFIAPNALVANYIRTKFSSLIANTFESLITHKPAIKIICASSEGEQKKSVLLAQNKQNRAQIYENYTFENFIVGHSNQLA
ncbi:MAG: chromosomal replication initiator protein DnaA, partial [Campylobacter sp.]|nr:chromosomal replication initiator protein DnaA [Campylobacter sp.]